MNDAAVGKELVDGLTKFADDLERGDLSGYRITTVRRPMNTDDAAKAAERAAKCPAGPWTSRGPDSFGDGWVHVVQNADVSVLIEVPCDFPEDLSHMSGHPGCEKARTICDFIANARTDVPALVVQLAAARQDRERLAAALRGILDLEAKCDDEPNGWVAESMAEIARAALADTTAGG